METPVYEQLSDVRAFVCLERPTSRIGQPTRIGAVLHDVINNQEIAAFNQPLPLDARNDSTTGDVATVLEAFATFCAQRPVWSFDDEQDVLERLCAAASIDFPFYVPFIHVKALLPGWGVRPVDYASGAAHARAGIPRIGADRSAVDEARSLAALVNYFEDHEAFRN